MRRSGEFAVARREGGGSGQTRKFAEFATFALRQGLLSGLDRRRGLAVVGLFVGRLEDVLAELHLFFRLRQRAVASVQCGDGCRRTGHDTPQQHKRGPVADALLAFVQRLAGTHEFGAKLVGLLKQISVGVGQAVMLVGQDAFGETTLGFPNLHDVLAGALHEMPGEFDTLRFGQRGDFVAGKFRPEQREQRTERFGNAAVRRGREQNETARRRGREVFQEFVALVLVAVEAGGGRRAVRLVHDHEVGAMLDEIVALQFALQEVNADNLERVVAKDAARTGGDAPFKLADRAGTDDDGVEVEFLVEFLLPLLAQIGRAQDAEAFDFSAIQQLAHDEQPLDGFADANIVGDEHPNRGGAQGHERRHKLIDARANGYAAQRAEQRRAFAQREPRHLSEQVRARDVGRVGWCRRREFGRSNAFFLERVANQIRKPFVDGNDLVTRAGQRPE